LRGRKYNKERKMMDENVRKGMIICKIDRTRNKERERVKKSDIEGKLLRRES